MNHGEGGSDREAQLSCKYCSKLFRNSRALKIHMWRSHHTTYHALSADQIQKLYWDSKLSIANMAQFLGVPYSTLYHWFKKYDIPRRSKSQAIECNLPEPKLDPSPELSYVLGVLLGDGFVSRRKSNHGGFGYSIGLHTTNLEFAQCFSNALSSLGLNPKIYFDGYTSSGNPRYYVVAFSKKFYDWYRSLKPTDILKLLTNTKCKLEFIRGFYESEGCYWRKKMLFFANTNLQVIELVQRLLSEFNFKTKVYVKMPKNPSQKPCYRLEICGKGIGKHGSRKAEIERFIRLVNPIIKR
jgi:DNA endonuclease related to intein-encoded endonucleases